MTFCEFVEILREEVGKLCGDGARVMIQEVTGNNGTVHTAINMAKEGEKVSPVIHLEAYCTVALIIRQNIHSMVNLQ